MLALIAAAVIASASPLPSVDDLIVRHRHALGRLPATTAHWAGSVAFGDDVEKFEVTADYTGRYRQSWTSPLGTVLEGSDGKSDWAQDENGDVTTRPARHLFSLEFALLRLNDFRLDDASGVVVTGPVPIDGHPAYALKVSAGDRSMTLYVDVGTSLVDGADAGDHVIRYRNYRAFDGTVVPTTIQDTADGSTVTRTIDDVKFGVSVAGQFDVPTPREPAFPTGATDVSEPFASPHGLIVVDAKINDKPVKLLLDSGSSSTLIDADVAKTLQLPTAGSAQIEGAAVLSGTYARADKLDVAGISFAPFVLEAVPLRLPAVIAHEGIQGVLGYDFLSHVVARISYYNRVVQFISPAAFKYGGTGSVLDLDLTNRVPYVPGTIGEADKGTFTIDTGSDEGLVLYSEFATAHPHDFVDPMDMQQKSSGGVGGDFTTRAGFVTEFNLGSFSVRQVSTEVIMHATGAFSQSTSDGLVGAQVLGRFRAVFLDYRGKRLILEQ